MPMNIVRAMREQPSPLDFVLPGMLAGTVGALVSPGGSGKSMLALQIAIAVASGHDLAGYAGGTRYPQGKVVFLAAEDPESAIAHRLFALGQQLTSDVVDKLEGQLIVEPLVGKQPNIMDKRWLQAITRVAEGARLLILDTLRRFHQLDENDSADMAQVVGALESIAAKTGCAVIFLHHSSKSAALQGQGDQQQASRGSSVLVDNIRWQFFLAGMSKAEAKEHGVDEVKRGFWVRAGVSKQNYGLPFAELWLRRVEGGTLKPGHIDCPGSGAVNRGGSARAKGTKREEF